MTVHTYKHNRHNRPGVVKNIPIVISYGQNTT